MKANSEVHTGGQAAHVPDSAAVGDSQYRLRDTLAIPANATAADLTFWHRFDFENNGAVGYDGGVLELSTDDERTWVDAGPRITAGGYNGSVYVNPARGNPLGGRPAWINTITEWQQVSVDLMPYRGQYLKFRFRMGTDDSNGGAFSGWSVDDVQVTYRAPLASCAQSWSEGDVYPNGARSTAAAGIGDTLYVFGGVTSEVTAASFKYSTTTDTWSPIAALPEPRQGAGAVSDGTYVYILGGGRPGGGIAAQNLWRYDPTTNSYTTLAPFTTGTAYHAVAYLDGAIYRIAGRTNLADLDDITTTVEIYTIASNSWDNGADYPLKRQYVNAIAFDGYLFAAGGESDSSESVKTYRYDPTSGVWDDGPIADFPPPGGATAGALYNGTWALFAPGGSYGWNPLTNIWRSLDQIPRRVFIPTVAVAGGALQVLDDVPNQSITGLQAYRETSCAPPSPSPTATRPPTVDLCLGDCGDDRAVSVAELIRGVGIALSLQPLSACPSFDGNSDGAVGVNELVAAVNNALRGCPS